MRVLLTTPHCPWRQRRSGHVAARNHTGLRRQWQLRYDARAGLELTSITEWRVKRMRPSLLSNCKKACNIDTQGRLLPGL